ncbi:hypothetical protein QUA41_27740 [Microcoleus sp. Pol11C1]|uniref:hypothetical protein n=1 Tax=Microcoleus sp. POL1_C1 TaxID=2818870 RepID=UPI002FD10E08
MLHSFTRISAQCPIVSCAIVPDGVTIVAGDAYGRVYFLRLEGIAEYLEKGMA